MAGGDSSEDDGGDGGLDRNRTITNNVVSAVKQAWTRKSVKNALDDNEFWVTINDGTSEPIAIPTINR